MLTILSLLLALPLTGTNSADANAASVSAHAQRIAATRHEQ